MALPFPAETPGWENKLASSREGEVLCVECTRDASGHQEGVIAATAAHRQAARDFGAIHRRLTTAGAEADTTAINIGE